MVKRFNSIQVYDTTELSKNVREKLFNGQVSKVKRILYAAVSQSSYCYSKNRGFIIASIMYRLSTTVPISTIHFTH